MLKKMVMFAAVAGLVFSATPAAQAYTSDPGGFEAPGDLNPGDTYKLIFVTSGTHNAVSTDITVYNDWVHLQAFNAGLASTNDRATADVEWRALASTASTGWLPNVGPHPIVYLLNGPQVWDGGNDPNYTHMSHGYQSILAPIGNDESGNAIATGPWAVWTGSHANGLDWGGGLGASGSGTVGVGSTALTGYQWMMEAFGGTLFNDWDTERHFYAMSEELEVIPEPVTMALLAFGGLGVLLRRRSRKA